MSGLLDNDVVSPALVGGLDSLAGAETPAASESAPEANEDSDPHAEEAEAPALVVGEESELEAAETVEFLHGLHQLAGGLRHVLVDDVADLVGKDGLDLPVVHRFQQQIR